jgi:hypothetical protein
MPSYDSIAHGTSYRLISEKICAFLCRKKLSYTQSDQKYTARVWGSILCTQSKVTCLNTGFCELCLQLWPFVLWNGKSKMLHANQPTVNYFFYKTLIPVLHIALFITVNYKEAQIAVLCFRTAYKLQPGRLRINQHFSCVVCCSSAKPFNCRSIHSALKMVQYIQIRQGLSQVVLCDMQFVCLDLSIVPNVYHSERFNDGALSWMNHMYATFCSSSVVSSCIGIYEDPPLYLTLCITIVAEYFWYMK